MKETEWINGDAYINASIAASARDCDMCPHSWDEHNGMGDCLHLDKRTSTGYCAHHQKRAA